jgi:hypothetical protein
MTIDAGEMCPATTLLEEKARRAVQEMKREGTAAYPD